ncbi:MAG: DMT family transporter [Clostridiales bacterium]|nr:DMT family transporter [Clostridiales bacterium]
MEETDRKKGISRGLAEALIVLQSVVYGFGDPISKIAFDVVPVYAMMSVRYSIAFAVCFLLFHKRIIKTIKTVPLRAWLIPGMCIGLSYLLNNVALAMTEATSVAFLRSMSVIITPALAFLIFRRRYRWQQLLAQILVLPGIYLLCVKGGLSGFGAGEAVALLAAALMAATLVLSQKYLEQVDPMSMTALQGGCSAVLALAGCVMFEGGIEMSQADGKVWAIILYLAIACTFLGYLMQNLALTGISERSVSLIQSLCPVMTAFFSLILLGERLSAAGVAGAAIIILCSLTEAWNWKTSSDDQKE